MVKTVPVNMLHIVWVIFKSKRKKISLHSLTGCIHFAGDAAALPKGYGETQTIDDQGVISFNTQRACAVATESIVVTGTPDSLMIASRSV